MSRTTVPPALRALGAALLCAAAFCSFMATVHSQDVACSSSAVYHPGFKRCVWTVLTSPAASEECPETFTCSDPTMPTSCGLYSNTTRGTWDPDYQCNRLYSRSLDYVLVLHTNGDLVVYFTAGPDSAEQPTEVVWSGGTSIGFEARSLVLKSDGGWDLVSENGPNRNVVLAKDVGFLNSYNGGEDLGPFTLYVSDDGGVWLVNKEDYVAWSTRSTGPPESVPPPSPVECRPGSVYSAAHGQCVWVELMSIDECDIFDRACYPDMALSCGLHYAPWDPDSQCSRLYSPKLDYVLILQADGNLGLYRHDAVTGELGDYMWSTGTGAGKAVSLTLQGSLWRLYVEDSTSGLEKFESPDFGTEDENAIGYENQPFFLRIGDDGILRIFTSSDQVAWTASTPPASPPPPPPPPPGGVYGSPTGAYGYQPPAYGSPAGVYAPTPGVYGS